MYTIAGENIAHYAKELDKLVINLMKENKKLKEKIKKLEQDIKKNKPQRKRTS